VQSLFPILKDQDKAVEFGVLKQKDNSHLPYLIDLVEDKSKLDLSTNLILEGVVSTGLAFGSLVVIGSEEISKGSLHLHYHNEIQNKILIDEHIIFYCQSPDIALLSLLETYNNSKIGFTFKEGSTLSHFAIILRERGIPAIVTNAEIDFKNGDYIDLDALNSGFLPSERLKLKAMKYVFPYINPDTDGVCASLSYSFLNNDFTPVIFGNFDNETKFVLNTLEIDYPKQVTEISNDSKIALVDTHHITQLPQINLNNVIEVIDHHPAGDSDKLPNAKIQNEEVGSACTLITERIIASGIIPTREIAGLLSFAIISNTLNFTAPSSTQRDENALEWLSKHIIISEASIFGMFKARSDISAFETYDLLLSNNKVFEIENKKISIIQLELAEVETLISRTDFKEAILKVQSKKQSDYCLFSGVDIFKRQSIIVVPTENEKELISNAMNIDFINDTAIVNRILLRKTDFVPSIQKYLAKLNA
jgi:manganese-dependent inorganic pyrophosphatase